MIAEVRAPAFLQGPVQGLEREIIRAAIANHLFGMAPTGPTLGGYLLVRRVGTGGMGVVFEARQVRSRQRVALKVLQGTGPKALQRLKGEFRSLSGLYHPNLVQLHELCLESGEPFLTMEFVDGHSWLDYVRPAGRLHLERLAQALSQLIDGVSTLHAAGMMHRDLKPPNVLIETSGRLVVLDFGLARAVDELSLQGSEGTSGTPMYMAPERLACGPVGPPSDWYSVGVMLREALAGGSPQLDEARSRPERELKALCVRLLADDPAMRPQGAELREWAQLPRTPGPSIAASRTAADSVFLGREHELERLDLAFWRSATQPVLVHVSGEPGIGKSALVRHALERWRSTHVTIVLSARCYERESIAYNAIDGLVDALVREIESMPLEHRGALAVKGVEELCRLFPVAASLGWREQCAPAFALTPQQIRKRACDALRTLLQVLTSRGRVVIHLDDLQWADADSAQMLHLLLQVIEHVPLLLIASYRAADAEHSAAVRALREVRPEGSVPSSELALRGLNGDCALALGRKLVAQHLQDGDLAELIAGAEGQPLFICMLARYLGRDSASHAASAPRVSSGATVVGRRWMLPQLLAAVVAPLPDGSRILLELSALAGTPVHAELLLRAATLIDGVHGSAERVSMLQASGLLRSIRLPHGGWALECFHDRLREVVAAGVDANHRRACHLALAQVAADAGIVDAEFLAVHYEAAGELELAAQHAERAGDEAFAALALQRASTRYQQALRLRTRERPLALVHKLADTTAYAGRCAAAAPLYLEVAEGAEPSQALRLRLRAGEMLLRGGSMQEHSEVIKPVLRAVGVRYPGVGAANRLWMAWSLLRLQARGIDLARLRRPPTPQEQLRIDACLMLGASYSVVDMRRACSLMLRAGHLALESGTDTQFARCLAFRALLLAVLAKGTIAQHDATLASALDIARRCDDSDARSGVLFLRTMMHFATTRFHLALRSLREAQSWISAHCADSGWLVDELDTGACALLNMSGNFGALEAQSGQALARAVDKENAYQVALIRCNRGFLSLVHDDPAAAIAEADAVLSIWERAGEHTAAFSLAATATWLKLHALLYAGDAPGACQVVQTARPRFARAGYATIQPWRSVMTMLHGTVALSAARMHRGRRHLKQVDQSIRILQGLRWPFATPSAALLGAGLAQFQGRPALTLYAAAVNEYEAHGHMGYAACARMRQGQLLGGAAGDALQHRAWQWFRTEGIVRPEHWIRMYAPIGQ